MFCECCCRPGARYYYNNHLFSRVVFGANFKALRAASAPSNYCSLFMLRLSVVVVVVVVVVVEPDHHHDDHHHQFSRNSRGQKVSPPLGDEYS